MTLSKLCLVTVVREQFSDSRNNSSFSLKIMFLYNCISDARFIQATESIFLRNLYTINNFFNC